MIEYFNLKRGFCHVGTVVSSCVGTSHLIIFHTHQQAFTQCYLRCEAERVLARLRHSPVVFPNSDPLSKRTALITAPRIHADCVLSRRESCCQGPRERRSTPRPAWTARLQRRRRPQAMTRRLAGSNSNLTIVQTTMPSATNRY